MQINLDWLRIRDEKFQVHVIAEVERLLHGCPNKECVSSEGGRRFFREIDGVKATLWICDKCRTYFIAVEREEDLRNFTLVEGGQLVRPRLEAHPCPERVVAPIVPTSKLLN